MAPCRAVGAYMAVRGLSGLGWAGMGWLSAEGPRGTGALTQARRLRRGMRGRTRKGGVRLDRRGLWRAAGVAKQVRAAEPAALDSSAAHGHISHTICHERPWASRRHRNGMVRPCDLTARQQLASHGVIARKEEPRRLRSCRSPSHDPVLSVLR
eukprot:8085-Chlamydomonas_euryale.AAC.4